MTVYELEQKLKEAGIETAGYETEAENGALDLVMLSNDWQVQYFEEGVFVVVNAGDHDLAECTTVEEVIAFLKK